MVCPAAKKPADKPALPTHLVPGTQPLLPGVKTPDACQYSFAVHTSAEADAFHQDSCVKEWMSRMADREGCIAYMAGISEGNASMAACSVHDLGDICEQQAAHFKQSDAEALCAATNAAASEFWHSRAKGMAHGAAHGAINQAGCPAHAHDEAAHGAAHGAINQAGCPAHAHEYK